MNYRTIKRSSASELVMQEILNSIKSGDLKPGDKLPPERELTKLFGVGRSTVREATSALVRMGCLKVIQGKGTFLKEDFQSIQFFTQKLGDLLAAENVVDLIELREILECNIARLAAKRADAEHIQQIKEAIENMKESVDDIQVFSKYDFDFHISIAKATGNEMIFDMMRWIVEKVLQQYHQLEPKILFRMDMAIITAEKILSAIKKGEEEEAACLMGDHLNLVTTELKRIMPEIGWEQ
jgi:GntR family transcriptional repressor for pyruvate dehydrogenase complex